MNPKSHYLTKLFSSIFLGFIFIFYPLAFSLDNKPIEVGGQQPVFPGELVQNSVINGKVASNDDFLSKTTVRLLLKSDEGVGTCTGVILSNRFILSAGHCLEGKDLKITVQFRRGGEKGFIDKEALSYRWFVKPRTRPSYPKPLSEDGAPQANPDKPNTADFYDYAASLQSWTSRSKEFSSFFDLALIKIDRIPEGYRSVKPYSGRVNFRQWALSAGYGLNNRGPKPIDDLLRYSPQQIIGAVTAKEDDSVVGWNTYSPGGRSVCFGDSGGPLFVNNEHSQQFELLGINVEIGLGSCSTDSYAVYIGERDIFETLVKWAEDMMKEENM